MSAEAARVAVDKDSEPKEHTLVPEQVRR
ncbi:MAG: hypothetical protein HW381_1574, partial [Candidatus Rokubacteria bacterium]|nr:hypothetical protein [Candidatus Rokubacteria bacterium]